MSDRAQVLNLFFRHPRLLFLTILLIMVAGFAAWHSLPRLEDPQSSVRWAYIFTRYPGADALRVETRVTDQIESAIRQVEGIDSIESQSHVGISTVFVRLKDQVTDVDLVWTKVRDKLADVSNQMPPDALKPVFFNDRTWNSFTLIVALAWESSSDVEPAILSRLARDLEEKLRYVPGTRFSERFGEAIGEVRVEVVPAEIAALGLTPAELARKISEKDAKTRSAEFQTREDSFLFDVSGELDQLADLRRIPIGRSSAGKLVRLGDLATVKRGLTDPPPAIALVNGNRAVAVAVRMDIDYQIDPWTTAIYQRLEEFEKFLPAGVGLHVLFDQSRYTRQRTNHLLISFWMGIALVVVVVLLIMGWEATIPVCSALPLTVLLVLAGLSVLGMSIEQMSIGGLILALGMLIDNPIIVVDELYRRLRSGERPGIAVADSVRHLFVPLFGSTLTTVLAFAPLLLLPGATGEFLSSLSTTVILALSGSLLLSLTVVPAVAAWTFKLSSRSGKNHALAGTAGLNFPRGRVWLDGVFQTLFRSPAYGILASILFPLLGFAAFFGLDEQFFPPAERDHFHIEVRLPPHSSIARTGQLARELEQTMRMHPEVTGVYWFLGASAPKIHYSMLMGEEDRPYFTQAIVQLKSNRNLEPLIKQLQIELDDSYPEVQAIVHLIEQGPPAVAPIEFRIYGPDLSQLQESGELARAVMAGIPGVAHVRTTLLPGRPKLVFQTDETAVELADLSNAEISRQASAWLDGAVGGSIREGTEESAVRVILVDATNNDISRLSSLAFVPMAKSADTVRKWIPLTALGNLETSPELESVSRRNGRRCNIVQGYVTAGFLPAEIEKQFRQRLEEVAWSLPAGYETDFGGTRAQRNTAVRNLMAYFGILATMIVATVVLTFRSFSLATLIGLVAVLAGGLGLLALWLFSYPFGMLAIIGTMGLIGVAINDSIVVLVAIREHPAAREGDIAEVSSVVMQSTRHVISTTLTTAAGFTPLILAGGDFWPPLAIVIAAGVLGATLLALWFIPCAYLIQIKIRNALAVRYRFLAANK